MVLLYPYITSLTKFGDFVFQIWKARECLGLFPNSRNARAEVDIIDALTVKLPTLGVNILPLQFRQIKDPMEIIKLAIRSQAGAYLNVDELIEIAKLLGLISQDEISAVQEAIAREAAVAGDLQLAFGLCVVLAKKGHGSKYSTNWIEIPSIQLTNCVNYILSKNFLQNFTS